MDGPAPRLNIRRTTDRKMKKFWVIPILAIALASSGSQEESMDSLVKRARDGDVEAVFELGRSGDPQAMNALLPLFHEPGYRPKREVRLALAKAGDVEALQYFACRSMTGSVQQIEDLIKEDLNYIGGEFTVRIYRQLLDSDQRFLPDMDRTNNHSDTLLRFPGSTALLMLAKLLPSATIPKPSPLMTQAGNDHDIRAKWADWIDGHEGDLHKFKPSADNISFESSYCSDYDISAAIDRTLRMLSGEDATNCGRVEQNANPASADKCVKARFTSRTPFFVRYDVRDVDEDVAVGLASGHDGIAYAVAFDDVGVSTSKLGDQAEVTGGGNGVVVPCPRGNNLKQSVSKGLTCLSVKGNSLLSPE